jgi:23S rRNA pseudouridine1911/1915/1917 synthase
MPLPDTHGHVVVFHVAVACDRLDVFLSQQPGIGTRSHAQRLIRQGAVTLNNAPARPAQAVREGDVIEAFIAAEPQAPVPEDVLLSVLYEDDEVLVIDKPAGMVVHPAPGHTTHTLVNALLGRHPDIECGETMRPGIVHRLDKDTSGVMVVALTSEARDWLVAQFKSAAVHKTYLALVSGRIEADGVIEGPIGRHPVHRKRMAVVATGKPARTTYEIVEHLDAYTLVRAHPVTGRTHQIRVHFAFIGHPVAGDYVYGSRSPSRSLAQYLPRHFLHAAAISLRLPHASAEREFTSPLPPDLRLALDEARRQARAAPCPAQSDMI